MLTLGRIPISALGQKNSVFDPDALAWFTAVEAGGANFGPNSTVANANKKAWSDWVVAQKNAASPVTGRTNWQQLTQTNEGYIQPIMGVSTFNVPPLFGGSTFTGFVAGDYLPALGLKGGSGKVLLSSRALNAAPQNDVNFGLWVTGASTGALSNRLFGNSNITLTDAIWESASTYLRSSSGMSSGDAYNSGSFPRAAFISRHQSASYVSRNGASEITHPVASEAARATLASYFASQLNSLNSDVRAGLAFGGRAINLSAMNAACIALSAAITWP